MTSSTSDSDPLHLSIDIGNPIVILVTCIATFCTLGILILSVNLYVDPYDHGFSPIRKPIRRDIEFRKSNVSLWSTFDIMQLNRDQVRDTNIVLLGDSRIRLFSGGPYSNRNYQIEDSVVLDLAFGGASLSESIGLYMETKGWIDQVDLVILSLPYDRLSDPELSPDRTEESFSQARWPVRYYFNVDTFRRSLPYLFKADDSSERLITSRPDHIGSATSHSEVPVEPLGELEVRTWARSANVQLLVDDALATFDEVVQPFLDKMDQEGVEVLIFVPPNSPRLESFLTKELTYRFDTFQNYIRSKADVYRLDPRVTEHMGWVDDWHVRPEAGPYLFDMLLLDLERNGPDGSGIDAIKNSP